MIDFFAQKKRKVRILWSDAVLYGPKKIVEQLTPLETIGILEKEEENFLIIKSPKTVRRTDGTSHPDKVPTFYFIPRGMIEKIEFI